MPTVSQPFTGPRRHLVIGVLVVVGLGALYLIAAAVNGLVPFGSGPSPSGPGAGSSSPGASAAQGPGTTVAGSTTVSLDQLMPDQGCDPAPASVTQGLTGLTTALQCTNDPNLSSVVVDGFQFDTAADYGAGLQVLDRALGFHQSGAGSSCPPSGSDSGSFAWQSSDYPEQTGQVLQCLLVSGKPTYLWTIPSRLVVIEAVDTDAQDGFSGLQDWFVNDAEP